MEKDDDVPARERLTAANDNDTPPSPKMGAALTIIARAIGRQIARDMMRTTHAANDNGGSEDAGDP